MKQITNKDTLYNTGNATQYFVIRENSLKKIFPTWRSSPCLFCLLHWQGFFTTSTT